MGYPSKDALERTKLTLDIAAPFVTIAIVLLVAWNLTSVIKFLDQDLHDAGYDPTKFGIPGFLEAEKEQGPAMQALQGTTFLQNQIIEQAMKALSCSPNCSQKDVEQAKTLLTNPALSQNVQNTLTQTHSIATTLYQTAAPPATISSDWAVVISADTNEPQAAFEVTRAQGQYPRLAVETVKRGNWLRTVIHFPTAEAANAALETIQGFTGRTPYLRDFSVWCPNPTAVKDGPRVCGQSSGD